MNANKPARRRRSPEAARQEILAAAEERLRAFGVEGLNVADVARDCGMSHATVIHHFGSTAGMRTALVGQMTNALLTDVLETLRQEPMPSPPELLRDLFATLSEGGHAKLLAWLSVSNEELAADRPETEKAAALFEDLVPVLGRILPDDDERERNARKLIYLVATAAIGYGVAGDRLADVLAMDESEASGFPEWLGLQIEEMLVR